MYKSVFIMKGSIIAMQKRAYELMKAWCDTLLTYRVDSPHALLDGALLCPACHVIHGRIADLAFPLTLIYVKSGEEKYIKAADKLIDWSELNLLRPDGSWVNDAGNMWKGISAFSAASIGEAIYRYGGRLPSDIREKWMKIFIRLSDYINTIFLKSCKPNINYYAGAACEQALAFKLTGETRYLELARAAEAFCRARFDENGLLYGEKVPVDDATPKGVRPIDMGYNIEESLPSLLRCAELIDENKDFYRERLRDHLEFLLPDGAIDNSWGSRHNKWTWWGSRTSDGALSGLALLADEPIFADACERVLSLYESCTHDSLLSLPMAKEAGEPTCLHHSFCHAKALAVLADADPIEPARTLLPCEVDYGIKFFENQNVALISHNGWRATISASDILYARGCENGGGSITLLLKDGLPICAATMRIYNNQEPLNMQYLRSSDQIHCMTPRMVFSDGGDNLLDMKVRLEKTGEYSIRAYSGDWEIDYSFEDNVKISIRSARKAKFILPIIKHGDLSCENNSCRIGNVSVKANGISCIGSGFNEVGGFIWQILEIPFEDTAEITIIA